MISSTRSWAKPSPTGVYDLRENQGWVSVGIDHDTARFAAEAIRRWWRKMGSKRYANARDLLITADGGGSNGSRCRLWKVACRTWRSPGDADSGVPFPARHQQVEQDRASDVLPHHAELAWPPVDQSRGHYQLDCHHDHQNRLEDPAELDTASYPTGIKVTDEELAAVKLKRAKFHGDWNYADPAETQEKVVTLF